MDFLTSSLHSLWWTSCVVVQSYEIKQPSQAFLDGRSSPWKKLRQVGCYAVARFRLVTIDSYGLIKSCLLFTSLNLDHNTQPFLISRENIQNGLRRELDFIALVIVTAVCSKLQCRLND